MKKKLTRLFSVLLAAVLVFGNLPVSAMGTDVADPPASAVDDTSVDVSAAEPEETTDEEPSAVDETPDGEEASTQSAEDEAVATYASSGVQYKIVHLDCGRKYFSKDWIIALLYEMQNDGYNQLQLAFGNDGLRFLLNDMSFTANGTTYDNDTVVAKVKAGNKAQNSSGDESYLTEAEMDEIIAKADELGIEIVPLLNLPGHANAILDIADDAYNASGSQNTLNVASDAAVNFGVAIFQKYVDYFAAKDCQFFNFGADEYANDTVGGFANLQQSGYNYFASFVSKLAKIICDEEMTPRAFNDGLYYKKYTMNTDDYIKAIQCCYWSSGWSGYDVASASTIAGNGHDMINTHGDYYYVLGKDDKFTPGVKGNNDPENVKADYTLHNPNLYTEAAGFSNTNFIDGSTISNPVGSMFCIWCDYPNFETEQEVAANTRLVLRAMAQRMDNKTVSVSDNVVANGFNADGTVNKTTDDSLLKISIGDSTEAATSGKLAVDGTMVLTASKAVIWESSDYDVASLTPIVEDGANAIEAEKVEVKALKAGNATITATSGDQKATFELTVQEPETKTIVLTVGESKTERVNGDWVGTYTPDPESVATALTTAGAETNPKLEAVTELTSGEKYLIVNKQTGELMNQSTYPQVTGEPTTESAELWTWVDPDNDGIGTLQAAHSGYLTVSGKYAYISTTSQYQFNPTYDASKTAWTISATSTYGDSTYYLYRYSSNDDVRVSGKSETNNGYGRWIFYKIVPGQEAGTDVTFTGVSEGEATVTIGGTKYIIKVVPKEVASATPLDIEYWITNARLTGTTSNKDALTIEAADAYSEEGLTVATLVDQYGAKDGRNQEYWKAVMLDTQLGNSSTSRTELQTEKNGDDETLNGTAFTKVRYWGGKWQVYTTTWVDVDRTQVSVSYTDNNDKTVTYNGDRHQLVAYYMEVVDIANANNESELHVNAADWGTKGDGENSWGDDPNKYNHCSVSVQVVYEDSSTNPASTTADDLKSKTIVYGYWSGGRGLGTMLFTGMNDYEIYKISAETGTMKDSVGSNNTVTVTSFTWDKNEEVVWGGDDQEPAASASIGNPARTPSYKEPYDNLAWNTSDYNKNNAILIRVYVKAHETPDSLRVHYIDATDGKSEEFYSYNINVQQGMTFDAGFALENGVLTNNTVTNNVGVTQTVESDLKKMTSIGAQYRYSDFTCVNAERSEYGKDVYLYYTFNDTVSFIVDFGTPLKIEPRDINASLVGTGVELTSVEVKGANHGTVEKNGTTFTYTPDSRFTSSEDGETLTVTYTGKLATEENKIQEGSKAYQVYIYPASNVLYEEGFLSTTNTELWKKSEAGEVKQQVQKAGNGGYYNFGYESDYYSTHTGANGLWTATGLEPKKLYTPLTTSFYGNTFDLIGNCGPTTGRVMLVFKDADDKYAAVVDVDTRYSKGDINQVPLTHVTLRDGTDANYTVTIYASGLEQTTVTAPNGVATMSIANGSAETDELLAEVLAENDLTLDEVEYISTSVENTIASNDASAVAVYSADATPDGENSTTITHEKGTHVEIDGFRVYRTTDSTDAVAKNYPDSEKDVTYANILDVVDGKIVAYTELKDALEIEVKDYEASGGPQYEIYLVSGQSIYFRSDKLKGKQVQVSLRAVNSTATANITGAAPITLATNTEMYYTITPDENGGVTIANKTENTLLAIGNVKLPEGVTAADCTSASATDKSSIISALQAVLAGGEEPEVFVPKTFTAKTTATPVIRNKVVTLKVNVSSDVAYITVNGVKYTRTGLQGLFQATRTIRVVNTVPKNQTKTYEVIAYNADGVASETITVTG